MIITTAWADSEKFPAASLWAWYFNVRKHTNKHIRVYVSQADHDKLTIPMEVENFSFHILKNPTWKGWWGKIELFAEQTDQLFIDIDTRVTKNLDALRIDEIPFDLVMLQDARYPDIHGGGVLFIRPSPLADEVYNKMVEWGDEIQKAYVLLPHHFGDQGYISQTSLRLGIPIVHWQRLYPKEFYCATPDCVRAEWDGEAFVYLSGEPTLDRLDEPEAPWNKSPLLM